MKHRCIVRGMGLGIAVLCLPAYADLIVTGTVIGASAYAQELGSPLPNTSFLSSLVAPIADATTVSTDVAQFNTVRASAFQSFSGFDAASASIKDSFALNPVASSHVLWDITLTNAGLLVPSPVPVGPLHLRFGFTIPSAGMQCVGCLVSPDTVSAEIKGVVSVFWTDHRHNNGNYWTFRNTLTVNQTAGAVLDQGLILQEQPTPVMTITGDDVTITYAPFSFIVEVGDLEFDPRQQVFVQYRLDASVAIAGYGGYADVSAFIADPFGLDGSTTPGPFPPGAQLLLNDLSVIAAVPGQGEVPVPGTWGLMLAGLGLLLARARSRVSG